MLFEERLEELVIHAGHVADEPEVDRIGTCTRHDFWRTFLCGDRARARAVKTDGRALCGMKRRTQIHVDHPATIIFITSSVAASVTRRPATMFGVCPNSFWSSVACGPPP